MIPIIEVDMAAHAKELSRSFARNEKAVKRATMRAERKFYTWAIRQLYTGLARATGISLKTLESNRRLFVSRKTFDDQVISKIWIGIDTITADKLGRATPTEDGVKIGKFGEFHKAFIVNNKVFYRYGKKKWHIARAQYSFADDARNALDHFELDADKKFRDLLLQELNFAINHEL